MSLASEERIKLAKEICVVANHRFYYMMAARTMLIKLGVPTDQVQRILDGVKVADFTLLAKTLRL